MAMNFSNGCGELMGNSYRSIMTETQDFEFGELHDRNTKRTYSVYEKALKKLDWEGLIELIEHGTDYTQGLEKNKDTTTALYYGAFYYRNDLVKLITQKHTKMGTFSSTFANQCTVSLCAVCINNNSELVDVLVGAGAVITEEYHIHTAVQQGSWAVLKELKKFHQDLDLNIADNSNNTPLYYASKNGHLQLINWLLSNGAKVNLKNSQGDTALHIACLHAEEDSVHLLIKRGANINAANDKGETPVLIAAKHGREGLIVILASEKANLDKRDEYGNFPLQLACENGHIGVIKELISNGANFKVVDGNRCSFLERAILSRRDGTAAMCVRLFPSEDFLTEYTSYFAIPVIDLAKFGMTETLNALLDRMVVVGSDKKDDKNEINVNCKVLTKYLDLDSENRMPDDIAYKMNQTYLLQRISQLANEKLAHHGTIRILVDRKMKTFGYYILAVKLLFHIFFLFTLGYSLTGASYESIPRDAYTLNFANKFRILTEILTVIYFIANIITEGVEFFRVTRLTHHHVKGKKLEKIIGMDNKQNDSKHESKWGKFKSFMNRLKNKTFIRMFSDYFSDKSNYWDVLGLLTLFILFILRILRHPIQWVFAAVTFFINAMRLFKLIVLIPVLGPYSTIIYKVLKNDVPKFAALFIITLFTFTVTFFVALRAPYTVQGLLNASLMQDTQRIPGIDDEVWWVLFSGLRILVQGNVFEGIYTNYIYESLNWLAATVYLTFLFLTVVVYINVFIAQLTDTFAKFKMTADYSFAWQRLNFIVQVQRTSFLSIFMDIRKSFFTESISMDKDKLNEYFKVYDIQHLNVKSFNENVDVKNMLSTIQTQQRTSEKIKNAMEQSQIESENTRLERNVDLIKEEMERRFDLIDKRMDKMFQMLEANLNHTTQPQEVDEV